MYYFPLDMPKVDVKYRRSRGSDRLKLRLTSCFMLSSYRTSEAVCGPKITIHPGIHSLAGTLSKGWAR